jgi:hypothetical protein
VGSSLDGEAYEYIPKPKISQIVIKEESYHSGSDIGNKFESNGGEKSINVNKMYNSGGKS